jgi:Tol biopolymer transport system component
MKKILNIYFFIILSFAVASVFGQSNKIEKVIGGEGQVFMHPVWSPDGSTIAFTSAKYKGIWTINLQNKNVKQITDEVAAGFGFKWSEDSKSILTRVSKYEGVRRYNAVKIFNIEKNESNLLTDYRTIMPGLPVFASNDEKVYLYGRNNLEIFDSGIQLNINKKSSTSSKIVFLKDDKIAVENLADNDLEVYEPVKGERALNLAISPDGNKVAFEIIGGDMYVMNTDGMGLTDLGKGYRPKWSPDNEHIVYMITEDDGHQFLSSDIYTIKIDGTDKTNLTKTPNKLEMNPDWSPDGKSIAFDQFDDGSIYIMQIN